MPTADSALIKLILSLCPALRNLSVYMVPFLVRVGKAFTAVGLATVILGGPPGRVAWAADYLEYLDGFRGEFGHYLDPNHWQDPYFLILPNETHPEDAKPIWKLSSPGVYLTVGTERGFIGAAYSQATHLLLLDHSSQVVHFNRMNVLLLKASGGVLSEFTRLRVEPEYLLDRVESMPLTDKQRTSLKVTARSHWWQILSKHFASSSLPSNPNLFVGANYFKDHQAFQKLYMMAIENRIQSEFYELGHSEDLTALVQKLVAKGLFISVLDLSNAWQSGYLGYRKTQELMKVLEPVTNNTSLVLITDNRQENYRMWTYLFQSQQELKGSGFFEASVSENSEGRARFLSYFQRGPNPPQCEENF